MWLAAADFLQSIRKKTSYFHVSSIIPLLAFCIPSRQKMVDMLLVFFASVLSIFSWVCSCNVLLKHFHFYFSRLTNPSFSSSFPTSIFIAFLKLEWTILPQSVCIYFELFVEYVKLKSFITWEVALRGSEVPGAPGVWLTCPWRVPKNLISLFLYIVCCWADCKH